MTVHQYTFTYTSPPHLLHDIHKYYTESKTSICNSPPTPTTHTTSHYVYINLTSVIDYVYIQKESENTVTRLAMTATCGALLVAALPSDPLNSRLAQSL